MDGGHFDFVLGLSRDLTCADSCFDSWINFPASTIKRAVFLFSSSTLRRNKADSSSRCDLAITPVLLSSIDWPPMRIIRLHKRPTPEGGTTEGCVKTSLVYTRLNRTPRIARASSTACRSAVLLFTWSGLPIAAVELPVPGRSITGRFPNFHASSNGFCFSEFPRNLIPIYSSEE